MSHLLSTAEKKVRDLPSTPLSVVNCASAGTLPAEADSLRPLQGRLNKLGKVAREGEVGRHNRQQRNGQRTAEVGIGCTERVGGELHEMG